MSTRKLNRSELATFGIGVFGTVLITFLVLQALGLMACDSFAAGVVAVFS